MKKLSGARDTSLISRRQHVRKEILEKCSRPVFGREIIFLCSKGPCILHGICYMKSCFSILFFFFLYPTTCYSHALSHSVSSLGLNNPKLSPLILDPNVKTSWESHHHLLLEGCKTVVSKLTVGCCSLTHSCFPLSGEVAHYWETSCL